jgi:ATP-dependent RNA helicase DDX46/PRP5
MRDRRDTTEPHSAYRKRSRSRSPPSRNGERASQMKSNAEPSTSAAPAKVDDKLKSKREKLEAWRKEREKKALEEAKQRAASVNVSLGKSSEWSMRRTKIDTPLNSFCIAAALPSTSTDGPTTIKAAGLKSVPAAPRLDFSKSKLKNVSAMDDVGEAPEKQIERFTLPPMSGEAIEWTPAGEAEDTEIGLVDDDEVHGTREDVTAALLEKRQAAVKAEEEKMQVDVKAAVEDDEEEVDPLDAFMAGVVTEVKQVNEADRQRMGKGKQRVLAEVVGGTGVDDGAGEGEAVDAGADELDQAGVQDLMALAASKVKKKEMAIVDHSKVEYEPFRKAFYHPPAEVQEMTEEDAERIRMEVGAIQVRGKNCPKPLTKWSYCGLPGSCLDVIKKLDYKSPTAIQAQAIPAIMSGRDIIGVAKTGSGKTMAFLLPMFRHIKDQRKIVAMDGPIGLIMTPTRELAVQIFRESKPFLKALGLRAVCVYGGAPISEQIAEMKKTAEIVVATPGRLIDLLTANSGRVTNLRRVTYLVLDEADRMFDMGFEPQVMKIVNNCPLFRYISKANGEPGQKSAKESAGRDHCRRSISRGRGD